MSRWEELTAAGDAFTCYSSALAAWVAAQDPDWAAVVDAGLHLVITEEGDGLFGFSHFPPGLAGALALARRGSDDLETALAGVRDELARHGRVIVSGDGFRLPWHVAHERTHVPHWFTLTGDPDRPTVVDPFDCRTELGHQKPTRRTLDAGELAAVLEGLPGDDPVLELREVFALGGDDRPLGAHRYGWLVEGDARAPRPAGGFEGPDALRRLARHFREHGHEPAAYRQADDLWSIGRHRSFAARRAEHLAPLAARWGHIAPLMMQARLSVAAGRSPSPSLVDALEDLAARETSLARGSHGDQT